MNNPRFCDLNACGVKVAQEVESGQPDLTIGAFVTNILITHLVANRDVINELTDRGAKTVLV